MQRQPSISLLIANYNNGRFFRDCYESLVAQTEKNWEAIIVDDASTDNSLEIINALIKEDSRFRFYRNEKNCRYQQTIINALSYSSAPIFARLDPDDALTPDALEKSLQAHYNHPQCGLVYSNFIFCDENLKPKEIHRNKQLKGPGEFLEKFGSGITHFASFKRSIYNKTSGFDVSNRRAEDQDIYMKMAEVAPVFHIDEELYLYRIHTSGASTLANKEKAYFWHWYAMIKMAERQNLNLEDAFTRFYIPRHEYEKERKKLQHLKNNKILKGINLLIGKIKNT